MPEQATPLDGWAIVEVLGHKKFAGHVSEQAFGSAVLIRVDVPETDQGGVFTKPYSKLIGPGSIYCITPCTEEIARAAAQRLERWNNPIPVDIAVQKQLPASVSTSDAELVAEEDDDDDREPWQR
jgi:hypothetical protein